MTTGIPGSGKIWRAVAANLAAATTIKMTTEARARRVAYRTRGRSHGPITRLVSPSDVGELIKPDELIRAIIAHA